MKIDTRAIRRALSAVEKQIKALQKERDRAVEKVTKFPRPRQAKNREAMATITRVDRDLPKLETQKIKIAGALDQIHACEDSCSHECADARDTGKAIAEKAPPAKVAVRRAQAPSEHDQRLIAQAHWFALMLKNDPRLKLPDIPIPATDWRPDGPAQVNKYKKIWRDVFDDFWWEAADVAISDLGSDSDRARDIAEAVDTELFRIYAQGGGNVQSMDNQMRKGKLKIPADRIFFPDEKWWNPGILPIASHGRRKSRKRPASR